jgi:hypothetical protein
MPKPAESQNLTAWVRSNYFYHSHEWKELRKAARARAGYVCEFPGCRAEGAHAHHIKSRWHYPDLALDLANLRIYCPRHHSGAHQFTKMPDHWLAYEPANDAQMQLPFEGLEVTNSCKR